ncbi:MAG: hypothetical protein ACK5HY_08635 [Parahaliea sp.]
MIYFIILLAVALALAPLSHFIPSRQQRQQARLREAAALGGLFVEFRNLPSSGGPGARVARADSIYYGLRLRPPRGRATRQGVWLRDGQGWRSLGERRQPLPPALSSMPASVLAASVDESSCGIYWRESAELSTVDEIGKLLKIWAGELEA